MQFRTRVVLFFLVCVTFAVQAQVATKTTVSGIVTDLQTREPLVGVTIFDKANPSVGTVTDIDGQYSLTLDTKKPVQVCFS